MTIQIRKSVFETNSSSSHSLTISESDLVAQPFKDSVLRAGVLTVDLGEYGWEWHRIYQPDAKIAYLLTGIFKGEAPQSEDKESIHQEYPHYAMLCDVVKKHTGVEVKVVPGSSGYIDHESDYVYTEAFKSEEKLHRLLFGGESYIQTGNDNDQPRWVTTDRGVDEDLFETYSRIPGQEDVDVLLGIDVENYSYNLTTVNGVEVNKTKAQTLLRQLQQSAIAEQVTFYSVGRESYFRFTCMEAYACDKVTDMGLYISPAMKVSENHSRGDKYTDIKKMCVVLKVSQELAEKIQADI